MSEAYLARLFAYAARGMCLGRRVLIRSPVVGSCSQIKQDCAGCYPDCKQSRNCPSGRASSRREPWSRFALTRFTWFVSNAIICDLKRRMSSIRRSSLISITLGLLTVIGGYLWFASLEEAAGQCLECPLEPCIRARRYGRGQARIIVEVEARACPLRQLQKTHGGCGGASVSTARVAYDASRS
jgi:hypothetical protein